MNTKQITIAALALLAGTAAMAGTDHQDVWAKFQNAGQNTTTLSRAEVIADLEIYNKSGLADLERYDAAEVIDADYQAAQARYQAMRASPEFAALVAKIAQQRGETVAAVSVSSGVVAQ